MRIHAREQYVSGWPSAPMNLRSTPLPAKATTSASEAGGYVAFALGGGSGRSDGAGETWIATGDLGTDPPPTDVEHPAVVRSRARTRIRFMARPWTSLPRTRCSPAGRCYWTLCEVFNG